MARTVPRRFTVVALSSAMALLGLPGSGAPAVAQVVSYRAIDAGPAHTCAIRTDNTPVCWGQNQYAQTTIPAGIGTVIGISAGSRHSCAVKSDGTPVCWGSDIWGQATIPAGIGTVQEISAGHAHTCAINTGFTPVCWGANVPPNDIGAGNYNQARIPDGTDEETRGPAITSVTQISAGHSHTCAIISGGNPACWGGATFDVPWSPAYLDISNGQSTIPEGIGMVTQITAGRTHTCVIKTDFTPVCWGDETFGQSTIPGAIGTVREISAGDFHTCARRSGFGFEGIPVCWGATFGLDFGQTTIPAGIGSVEQITAGGLHTCAIKMDGAAVCWGDNSQGQSTVPGVANAAPVNTASPVITGTPTVGSTLSASTGTWVNTTGYAYAWLRCASDDTLASCAGGFIPGADQASYTLVASDAKWHLRVMVTATNASGSTQRWSDAVEITSGVALPAVVRGSTAWLARDSLTSGDATTTFNYGARPLVPIMGDWDHDGIETPGTFEGGVFKLSNTMTAAPATINLTFGDPRGFPVIGDFNGDGFDDLAVYRAGRWQFRVELGGVENEGRFMIETPDVVFGSGNWPATIPVAGDWDGIRGDGIGFYTYATGAWQLRQTPVGPDLPSFTYWAGSGSYPIVGDWNADRTDSVGVKLGTSWQLNNQIDASAAEVTFSFGLPNDLPLSWKRPTPPPP